MDDNNNSESYTSAEVVSMLDSMMSSDPLFSVPPESQGFKEQTEEKNIGGRPRKNPDEVLSVVRKFRLTKSDAENLSRLARQADMSEADYIRWTIFNGHDNKKRKVPNAKDLQLLRFAFKRPAGLLNQLLAAMYSQPIDRNITQEELVKFVEAVRDIRQTQINLIDQVNIALREYNDKIIPRGEEQA